MASSQSSSINTAAVIMAGGAGTRFWPVSTDKKPKQFLNLFGGRTLIQQSFDRIKEIVPIDKIFVLTNKAFVDITREQLPEIPAENIIGEPCRRDTAAAAALAAALVSKKAGQDAVMITLTADHKIGPYERFRQILLSAVQEASKTKALYTLGIVPSCPAVGYGYLECGEEITTNQGSEAPQHYKLTQFKEKPNLETAEKFLKAGNYYWNSGMFVWSIDAITAEFRRQQPAHIEAMEEAVKYHGTDKWEAALSEAFEPLKKISIDYAVMENAQEVRMVKSDFEWLDLGGWAAAAPFLDEHDENSNSFRGELYAYQSDSNIVFTDNLNQRTALVGVSGMAVIHSNGNTLVVPISKLDEVKKLVASLPEHLR